MILFNFLHRIKHTTDAHKRILIIATNHTGNNIFCTPAIQFLKKHHPDICFDVVSLNKLSAEVFRKNPSIHKVYISKNSSFINKLSNNYAKTICLHREVLNMLPGLRSDMIVAPDYADGIHRAEHMLQFVAEFSKRDVVDEDRAYVIVGEEATPPILESFKVTPDDILVCMHLGCGRTKTHGWNFLSQRCRTHRKLLSINTYITFANLLIARHPNIRFVITGTKNEKFLGTAFVKSVPRTINLIAKTSIPELYHLMDKFSLFISHDCGIMHVASASGVPLIGLFGPTNPMNTGPYPRKDNHIIIQEDAMDKIQIETMLKAATTLLTI